MSNSLQHIAIIMDGNRRWAKQNNLTIFEGHEIGSKNIQTILQCAINDGVKYLSCYAFSSENWLRDEQEIEYLKFILSNYLQNEVEYFVKHKIKFVTIGDYTKFGKEISNSIQRLEKRTQDFDAITFIIALNYGSKDEILRAVDNICHDVQTGVVTLPIKEEVFKSYMYTKDFPDPDLLIRTGGEIRLSNFFLWQLSYTEMVFIDTMWPDFKEQDFKKAMQTFYLRKRRHGK